MIGTTLHVPEAQNANVPRPPLPLCSARSIARWKTVLLDRLNNAHELITNIIKRLRLSTSLASIFTAPRSDIEEVQQEAGRHGLYTGNGVQAKEGKGGEPTMGCYGTRSRRCESISRFSEEGSRSSTSTGPAISKYHACACTRCGSAFDDR